MTAKITLYALAAHIKSPDPDQDLYDHVGEEATIFIHENKHYTACNFYIEVSEGKTSYSIASEFNVTSATAIELLNDYLTEEEIKNLLFYNRKFEYECESSNAHIVSPFLNKVFCKENEKERYALAYDDDSGRFYVNTYYC